MVWDEDGRRRRSSGEGAGGAARSDGGTERDGIRSEAMGRAGAWVGSLLSPALHGPPLVGVTCPSAASRCCAFLNVLLTD